jgi:hypothetical protein
LGEKGKNEAAEQWDHRGEWMSTLGARPHHGGLTQPSSCVARRVAALDAAALPRRQSIPPARALWRALTNQFCGFAKFAQKLNWSQNSTKTKVLQNFASYKTYFGDQSQF